MEDKQDIHMLTLPRFWVSICAVACTVIGATWCVSNAIYNNELAQYRQSKDWDLPKNLDALGQLSERLAVTIDERKELERLRDESRRCTTEIEKLRKEIDHSHKEINDSRKIINDLTIRSSKLDETLIQNKQLSDRINALLLNLQAAQESAKDLSKRIKELEGDRFTIAKGEAQYIVPGVLAVGVSNLSGYLAYADIQIGSQKHEGVVAGTSFTETVNSVEYVITLLKITDNYCIFGVSKKSQ